MSNFSEEKVERAGDGKFAPKATAETEIDLETTPAVDWGNAGVRLGQHTVGGMVQTTHLEAPGITRFSTEGHGGVKLSPQRQKAMGALSVRRGVYEEDQEAYLVDYRFGDDIGLSESEKAHAEAMVRNHFPDQYEKYTGTVLEFGQSSAKDERDWEEQHAGDSKIVAVHPVEDGRHRIAVRDPDGSRRELSIPRAALPDRPAPHGAFQPNQRIYVAGADHQDITPEHEPEPEIHRSLPPKSKTTPKVEKDLSKIYRFPDHGGAIMSVQDYIGRHGVTERYKVGKRAYRLRGDGVTFTVSKDTFEAFDHVPEDTD